MTKQIPLTHGKVAIVDGADFERLSQHRWHVNSGGYAMGFVGGMKTYMHRMVAGATTGFEVDHINGDKLDNRRTNLRLCTPSQNQQNRAKRKAGTTSRYKGVSFENTSGKWLAQICINYTTRSLGRFDSEREAARAYNDAARKLHGEFARLNEVNQ